MRDIKLLLLVVIVAVAFVLAFTFLLPRGPKIIVQHKDDVKQTVYSSEDNSLSITTYDTEINEHILRLRSKSNLPLKVQVKIISKILNKVPKERQFRTFFIGRLLNAFGTDKTLSERLSLAASQSPLWDKEKGRPRSGHENQCIKEIANQTMIYPELREMFAKHGYEIQVSSVEKVLIDPQTKLPYDCQTWFSLSKP